MSHMTPDEEIAALNAIDVDYDTWGTHVEARHHSADKIVSQLLSPEVRAAYLRVIDLCRDITFYQRVERSSSCCSYCWQCSG